MRPRYKGWRSQIDQKYASRTVYAYVQESTSIVAAMRIVFKQFGSNTGKLPLEEGMPRICVPSEAGRVVEISGLVCANHNALLKLIADVSRWLVDSGVTFVFAIVNPGDPKPHQLLVDDLGFELLPEKRITYRNFVHKQSGCVVNWQILRHTRSKLRALLPVLEKRGYLAKPIVDMALIAPVTPAASTRRALQAHSAEIATRR